MANEGFLGRTSISGERAATDDHPLVLHALPLADDVNKALEVGTILKRVEIKTDNKVTAYAYSPWQNTDTEAPKAVVDKPCDPETETSAICIVHGCVKTKILKVGTQSPDIVALEKLFDAGIYAV